MEQYVVLIIFMCAHNNDRQRMFVQEVGLKNSPSSSLVFSSDNMTNKEAIFLLYIFLSGTTSKEEGNLCKVGTLLIKYLNIFLGRLNFP